MATIDPRVTPLIETLIASGADSIAVEILNAIQRGVEEEDSEDELREAREAVGHFRQGNRPREFRSTRETKVRYLTGEEQIAFAAEYVIESLVRALEMTDASLENLTAIANRVDKASPSGLADPQPVRLRRNQSEDDEVAGDIGREQLEVGRTQLTALREALSVWSTSAREGGQSK